MYINHPELQKKNYYSPSEEDFLKSVSPVSCDVQLGGSINFEYHVRDALQVRAKSLLGNHHDTIQTDSLYDVISEEYSVTPED
ncbi:hypothetical protein KA013_02915 [Patescibacteria group bacterium]|nr:hypothetical protein [Patescibacteria group bacterium]